MFRLVLILSLIPLVEFTVAAQMPEVAMAASANRQTTTQVNEDADLIESIKKGDLAQVLKLLNDGVSPDTTDNEGTPALIWSVIRNRAEIVEVLLARNAKVDKEAEDAGTALQVAASAGRADLVKLFIARGADVNHADRDGHTALMCAAFGATLKSAPEWLASSFFDIEEDTDLFRMMGHDHNLAAKLLIEAGANVNAQGADCGLSALMVAAMGGNVELTKLLLDHRANVKLDNGEWTALRFAEALGSQERLQEQLNEIEDQKSKQAFLNWIHFTAPGRQAVARMLRKADAK